MLLIYTIQILENREEVKCVLGPELRNSLDSTTAGANGSQNVTKRFPHYFASFPPKELSISYISL